MVGRKERLACLEEADPEGLAGNKTFWGSACVCRVCGGGGCVCGPGGGALLAGQTLAGHHEKGSKARQDEPLLQETQALQVKHTEVEDVLEEVGELALPQQEAGSVLILVDQDAKGCTSRPPRTRAGVPPWIGRGRQQAAGSHPTPLRRLLPAHPFGQNQEVGAFGHIVPTPEARRVAFESRRSGCEVESAETDVVEPLLSMQQTSLASLFRARGMESMALYDSATLGDGTTEKGTIFLSGKSSRIFGKIRAYPCRGLCLHSWRWLPDVTHCGDDGRCFLALGFFSVTHDDVSGKAKRDPGLPSRRGLHVLSLPWWWLQGKCGAYSG
ncbi:hypothetical protein GWK47_045021 [Chionoecetes opilio]|uniref:Uncharacterized protein n=1 Tax=Chionoecetes opilio TaxID=41210 RepID=A0A8J4Y632_CHIOP|nr:hypothetical protein GWK47_045021 [Chionoecetes opilio]